MNVEAPTPALQRRIRELEDEVAKLRQQRDAANALLVYVLEEVANGTE